jgi:phosphoglycerate dehydrogenase-like enzyme
MVARAGGDLTLGYALWRSGVDSIDVDAATEHGVLAANTPEESQVKTVREQATAQMLALKKA